MNLQVKQCASCGAPIGAHGRVCPRCGRGSLFGDSGLIAVLGVLLVGIGLASGLIPMDRIRTVAAPAAADSISTQPHPTATPSQREPTKLVPRSAKASSAPQGRADPTVAYIAPDPQAEEVAQVVSAALCARPDTALIRKLLEEPTHTDLNRIAAQSCEAAASRGPESAQFITAHNLPQPDSTSGSGRP
jgi:hypothetical protein